MFFHMLILKGKKNKIQYNTIQASLKKKNNNNNPLGSVWYAYNNPLGSMWFGSCRDQIKFLHTVIKFEETIMYNSHNT